MNEDELVWFTLVAVIAVYLGMKKLKLLPIIILMALQGNAQIIPLDTAHWQVNANAYVFETFKGQPSIYLQGGTIALKDRDFLNGTIEYDIFMKEDRGFPGIYFRFDESTMSAEEFYIRPHQSGNPDATQAIAMIQGLAPWQLYHGEKFAFAYDFPFGSWMHVKILVNGDRAQIFFDHSETPQLSWKLFNEAKPGPIALRGGNMTGFHIANIQVTDETPTLTNFEEGKHQALDGAVGSWEISDKFKEEDLADISNLKSVISSRKWQGTAWLEEGVAANISRVQRLNDGKPGNTVLARVTVTSDKATVRKFEFGYSDRVVVIANGTALYQGTNGFRTRDYRYLGTIGLFDSVYIPLKKGENTILMAVSEDFGGWLVTGRFSNMEGLTINNSVDTKP